MFLYNLPGETIIGSCSIVLCAIFFHVKFNEKATTLGPTLLTTLGIFFTFLGVSKGLANFDEADIQNSIPKLLQGLKTAFYVSAFGIAGALTLKIRYILTHREKSNVNNDGISDEITAQDLAKLLKGIQVALVGTDDSSLISQLKLSRSDSNDRLDALKQAQIEALQKLSEMGSRQLVEALRDVIKDFNTKITEQFGENFKQLNDAVGKMLIWQEQYKLHMDQISTRHEEIVESMKASTDNYKELVGKANIFSEVSNDLSSLLSGLQIQKDELRISLKSLADLLLAASGSLPEIEGKVMELTHQLSRAVTDNQLEVNKSLISNANSIQSTIYESTKQTQDALEAQQKAVNEALLENVKLIRISIQNVGEDFNKINQDFNKQLGETSDKIKQQVAILDKALAEELQKSLESLGRQLAALSEKFVSDYTPLTEKLRSLVQISRAQ